MSIKPSSDFYTVVTVAMGLGSVVFLFYTRPDIAPVYMVAALPIVVGIIGSLQKTKEVAATVDTLAPKVDSAVASSQQNNAQLAAVVRKVDTNTAITQQIDAKVDTTVEKVDTVAAKGDATYGLVDGQMSDFKSMMGEMSALRAEMAALKAHAAGITEGRGQAKEEAASNGPSVAAGASPADAAALGAANAVADVPPGASAGETADAAARGAAEATGDKAGLP